jgi:PBP1b-binding outer membrane lipoprotein LpoB
MKTKIIFIIILIIFLSGCIESLPTVKQVTSEKTNTKYVGTFDNVDLYQFRLESINATCIGGSGGIGYSRVTLLDCKYEE